MGVLMGGDGVSEAKSFGAPSLSFGASITFCAYHMPMDIIDDTIASTPAPDPTEEAFEEAFWRLYAQKPLRKISVSEVAEVAGYNRGTFYLHYESLDALLQGMEDDLLAKIRGCVADSMARLSAGEDPEAVMGGVLALWEQNADRLSVLLGSKGDPRFVDALKAELKPLWAKYVLKREAPADGTTDLTLEFTLSGAMFMLKKWVDNPKGVSPEDMLHLIYHKVIGK